MLAIVIFYTSLFFLVAMLAMKYFGISLGHHEAISNIVCENDKNVHKMVHHSKMVFSKIKFKNFHRLSVAIADFIKEETIYLKRRFDSKQPTFFLSSQKPGHINKYYVSFFLRKVSEYKESHQDKNL